MINDKLKIKVLSGIRGEFCRWAGVHREFNFICHVFLLEKEKNLRQIWQNVKVLQSWMVGTQLFLLVFSIMFLCLK